MQAHRTHILPGAQRADAANSLVCWEWMAAIRFFALQEQQICRFLPAIAGF